MTDVRFKGDFPDEYIDNGTQIYVWDNMCAFLANPNLPTMMNRGEKWEKVDFKKCDPPSEQIAQ